MNETFRAPQVVRLTPGRPNVPEPHKADYSADIPDEIFALIDDLCPQEKIGSGGKVKRFSW